MNNYEKYLKYKKKYLQLKEKVEDNFLYPMQYMSMQHNNNLLFGGGLTPEQQAKIDEAIVYAKSFIGIPYRWHRTGDKIKGDDKFWAENGCTVTCEKIKEDDKCIVCTGLANLVRRKLGFSIPGLAGELGEVGLEFPGTTGVWFWVFKNKERLEEVDFSRKYPIGTLLLADYVSDESQGHIAIIASDKADNLKEQEILHATSDFTYVESENMRNVGNVRIEPLSNTIEWFKLTHVCLPENWLLKD
jgi:hypothetical protein